MAGIFDILGPVMVGPSSSHTAGAARIGYMARQIFGRMPDRAVVQLSGSFAATGKGHGTDKAIVAGLLGMKPDDLRIPQSFKLAEENGMDVTILQKDIRDAHPNTARITMTGRSGAEDAISGNEETLTLTACSVGGGRIRVKELNGMQVDFGGDMNTLIIQSVDLPGQITEVTRIISGEDVNIATMQVYRATRGGSTIYVLETDDPVPERAVRELMAQPHIFSVRFISAA